MRRKTNSYRKYTNTRVHVELMSTTSTYIKYEIDKQLRNKNRQTDE